jgi:hypothetical protein
VPITLAAGSRKPLQQVIAYADGIGHYGQGRIHRHDADKETRVHDVQIIELMRFAVRFQRGPCRTGKLLYRPLLPCMTPPSAKMVVAVR